MISLGQAKRTDRLMRATTSVTVAGFEGLAKRLTSIGSTTNGASPVVSGFAYAYNNANQRVQTRLEDGSYWRYRYDRLGQVTSGKRYWSDGTPVAGQQFEYGFDDIGNRTSTKAGGDQGGSGLRSASYSVNRLNEYASRDVPGAVDVLGAATSIAPVWVNSSTNGVYRRGEYFRKQVDVSNSGNPVWQGVSAYAWDGTNYSGTESGNVFVAQTAEVFTHDADGNLLTDGRWTYTWDAENRLVQMVARTAVGPQQCIRFEYDWQGRRIRKQVWNNTGGTGTPALDQKFLYDGWNLLAELNATNNVPVRSYLWGSDLSGTMQGAGGVGGLLAVFQHEGANAGAHFCAFDGNGNITALVKATDGNTSARYEYGPFGETIRQTGPLSKANPFRFSTKYQEEETGCLYYGYRSYNPGIGRWLSRDPIAEYGGRNLQVFCNNSPVGSHDLLGAITVITRKANSLGCGGWEVDFEFRLDKAEHPAGYVVQRIEQETASEYCHLNRPPPTKTIYWEAWEIGRNAGWQASDSSRRPRSEKQHGKRSVKGEIKFFSVSTTGDLSQSGWKRGDQGGVPSAGTLLSTYTKPAWWDNQPDNGETAATRSVFAKWACCCDDRTQWFNLFNYSPLLPQ